MPMPDFRHAGAAVADRRKKESELHDERHDVTEIAVFHIQRAQPESRAEGTAKSQDYKSRKQKQPPVRQELKPDHRQGHQPHRDEKIHEAGDDRAGGNNQAWKVNLGNQVRVADEAVAGGAQRGGKELPGQLRRHHQQEIGHAGRGRQFGDAVENDGEHHRRQKRLNHRPSDANHRLFVADQDVAPGEKIKQLTVAPQVAPVILLGASGFDDEFVHLKSKLEIGKATKSKQKSGKQKIEIYFSFHNFCFLLWFSAFSLVRLIIVVMMAMSSSASFSKGRVSTGAIPHSSRSNSSHI